MNTKLKRILFFSILIVLAFIIVACSPSDSFPSNEAVYLKNLYVYDGATWNKITSNGGVTNPLTSDLDFAKYKAIAMAADNGATLPASPVVGQWFLHTPTGRKILYQYNGSEWVGIIAYGTTTLYVGSGGTDDRTSSTAGTASGTPFATVQYAVNTIPGSFNGEVYIYIGTGTFAEDVTLRDKWTSSSGGGAYSIYFIGTLTQLASSTATSKVQGATTTQGSLTKVAAFTGYANKLLYIPSTGEYNLIDTATADTATICGYFNDGTNKDYKVYDWGTTLQSITVFGGRVGVHVRDLKIAPTAGQEGITSQYNSIVVAERSYITGSGYVVSAKNLGHIELYNSLAEGTSTWVAPVASQWEGFLVMYDSKVLSTAPSYGLGIYVYDKSSVQFVGEVSVIDGTSNANGIWGITSRLHSHVSCTGYNRVRNWNTGVFADLSGIVDYVGNNQYSGNTLNQNADATTYAIITAY